MSLRRMALSLLSVGLGLAVLSPMTAADAAKPHLKALLASRAALPAARAGEPAALTEVRDLFSTKTPAQARAAIASGSGRDATMALRDLGVAIDQGVLAAGSAYAMFQRPWGYSPTLFHRMCSNDPAAGLPADSPTNVCVHWIDEADAADPAKANAWKSVYGTEISAQVTTDANAHVALTELAHISKTYQDSGYRAPLGESGSAFDANPSYYGGSNQTDVYMMEIGNQGLYGYCTVDRDDNGTFVFAPPSGSHRLDMPGFCVVDNDYQGFPRDFTQNLKVTMAHEYFHAVQFAYDYLEDRWFMEGSAAWIETQMYPEIDDNLQYLRDSPLTHPGTPLDLSQSPAFYGTWSFFEYLTQRLPEKTGALPSFMLRAWQNADTVAGPDQYSIQAVATSLKQAGLDFTKTFAAYAEANRHPRISYAEGAVNNWPTSGPRKTVKLKPAKKRASATLKVDHLAAGTVRFVPVQLKRKSTKLTVSVGMAKKSSGSAAVVTIYNKSGVVQTKFVKLKKSGSGRIKVPFSSKRITAVELTLVNANHSYTSCYKFTTDYSCNGGIPTKKAGEHYAVTVS